MKAQTQSAWRVAMMAACVLAISACSADVTPRSAGETCAQSDQCEANLCYEAQCMDPVLDDDMDGLTNDTEAKVGRRAAVVVAVRMVVVAHVGVGEGARQVHVGVGEAAVAES